MNETAILQRVRLAASKLGYRLSRNNSGALQDKNGRWVRYGCFAPGGADLIGYKTVRITEEHLGMDVAQFVAIEVKTPVGKLSKEQEAFLHAVLLAGGIAIVARSEDDLI
jgi:hypothetical protein